MKQVCPRCFSSDVYSKGNDVYECAYCHNVFQAKDDDAFAKLKPFIDALYSENKEQFDEAKLKYGDQFSALKITLQELISSSNDYPDLLLFCALARNKIDWFFKDSKKLNYITNGRGKGLPESSCEDEAVKPYITQLTGLTRPGYVVTPIISRFKKTISLASQSEYEECQRFYRVCDSFIHFYRDGEKEKSFTRYFDGKTPELETLKRWLRSMVEFLRINGVYKQDD
jgi:hypothetical protein